MRRWLLIFSLSFTVAAWAQSSNSSSSAPSSSPASSSATKSSIPMPNPNLEPPRSDTVNIRDVDDAGPGESSSKDTQIDLSPPAEDLKDQPKNSKNAIDSAASDGDDVGEFHAWDPHHAAKDIEVGDFYFKRKNYAAAESRYREALYYKDGDAVATYQLAVCLEKQQRPGEAREQYQNYLKILPHGPQAEDVRKALGRLKDAPAAKNQ
jgi:tetratricopeptide (TPR) repeat protein